MIRLNVGKQVREYTPSVAPRVDGSLSATQVDLANYYYRTPELVHMDVNLLFNYTNSGSDNQMIEVSLPVLGAAAYGGAQFVFNFSNFNTGGGNVRNRNPGYAELITSFTADPGNPVIICALGNNTDWQTAQYRVLISGQYVVA